MSSKSIVNNDPNHDESKSTIICDESSYNLKGISFEDSQVEHFIPYVSPFILANHSKNKMTNFTFFTHSNQTSQNESDIERMRGNLTNLATPSLIQYPSENTINSKKQTKKTDTKRAEHSIEDFENTNGSKINEISRNDSILLDKTIIQIESISPRQLEDKLKDLELEKNNAVQNLTESSNVLTNVTVENSQSKLKLIDQLSSRQSLESNLSSYSKRSLLSNYVKTPAGNVLGTEYRLKSNLFASMDISSDSSYIFKPNANKTNNMQNETASNDMATSPIKFITLSPTESNATKLFSEQSSINTTVSSLNSTSSSRQSFVRVSPDLPNSLETRLDYSKLSENSYSKISILSNSRRLNQEDKDWNKLADNYAAIKSQISNSSEYFESDTEYLHPANEKIENLIKNSFENSKKKSNQPSKNIEETISKNEKLKLLIENPVKILVENTKCLNLSAKDQTKNRTNEKKLYNNNCSTNKENFSSEMSTQTSFLVETKQERENKRHSIGTSPLNGTFNSFQKQINKEKIQELIQLQKQKHEKRIRELEKLAELERIQAEKLKNIMLNDSSLLTNSFFTDLNSKFSSTSNRKQISNNILDDLHELSDLDVSHLDDTNKTSVQVLELKDTTVRANPTGVLVIKETNHKLETQLTRSLPFDRRKTEIYHSTKRISPIKTSKRMSLAMNSNLKTNVGLAKKFTIENEKGLANMSLQEAFEKFRCDLISRSRLRQKEIKSRAEQRQQETELRRLHQEAVMQQEQQHNPKKSILKKSKSFREAQQQIVAIQSERRRMSIQEIKDQNRKLYEKLPEVRQKQLRLKMEEEKRLNRMKTSIFKKSIQQKVLSKGPNFHLNYKAIDDCV